MDKKNWNRMLRAHRRIAQEYMSPDEIRASPEEELLGLDATEFLEMAYENIQQEAKFAIDGLELEPENEDE